MKTQITLIISFFSVLNLFAQDHMFVGANGRVNFVENGTTNIKGNLINNGTIKHSANSSISFRGTGVQKYKSPTPIVIEDLTISNASGVLMDGQFIVNGVFYPILGHLKIDPNAVYASQVLFDSLSSVGATPTDASHIACPVLKRGNTAFVFPIGNGTYYKPLSISAPASKTEYFGAAYYRVNPSDAGFSITTKEASLNNVSSVEYWVLEQYNGSSSVEVGLSYNSANFTSFVSSCDLMVAHWNGTLWENKGNGTGSVTASGMLLTGNSTTTCGSPMAISNFSPFTLASVSSGTVLPVTWLSFEVADKPNFNQLSWSTASERNNDHFNILKSIDGVTFEKIGEIKGSGTTTEKNDYAFEDFQIQDGISYYQLEQVDTDGKASKSELKSVYRNSSAVLIAPNPANEWVKFSSNHSDFNAITFFNINGHVVINEQFESTFQRQIDLKNLAQGVYFYEVIHEDGTLTNGKLIINH